MKLLITGATGFIGRHLVPQLSARWEVFVLVRDPLHAFDKRTCSIIPINLVRPIDSHTLPERMDMILHFAQANVALPESANEMFAVNTYSTMQLLDYARRAGARRFILASTGDVYGHRLGPCKETDATAPASFYAVTKRASEMIAQAYSDYLEPCILRFFQPYGPGQSNRVIQKLADRIRKQEGVALHKGDRPNLTPIYIDDVIRVIERAVDTPYCGIVNVAGDAVVSMRDLAEEIGRVMECRPAFQETDEEAGDAIGDNRLMKQVFGDWPMGTLSEGLSRTLKHKEDIEWQTLV